MRYALGHIFHIYVAFYLNQICIFYLLSLAKDWQERPYSRDVTKHHFPMLCIH